MKIFRHRGGKKPGEVFLDRRREKIKSRYSPAATTAGAKKGVCISRDGIGDYVGG